jgi:mannose/fructose-specific phosphotransferase system component IIA
VGEALEVPYIILLTHGRWGEELIKGAEMIAGPIKNIYAFSLFPEQPVKDYLSKIETVLKDMSTQAIILTDLFGGTTSNIAAVISSKYDVLALSGLDIAMLIAADQLRTKHIGKELVDNIISKSINNCRNISQLLIDEQHNGSGEII